MESSVLSVTIDTSALIDWFDGRDGAKEVEQILGGINKGRSRRSSQAEFILMSKR
jgi:hypothetical protein